jgi:branched-chain amino acid transport system substrate-binding protein
MVRRSAKRLRESLSLSVVLSLLVAFLLSCGGPSAITGAGQSGALLKIGIALSLTGGFSDDGKALERGYQLWADNVNARGGLLGRMVTLDIVDDASSPDQVQSSYQKLITVDKVDLVFGPFSTILTKLASLVASQYGYALIEGSGGGPSVFNRGLHNVFDVSLPVASNLVSFAHYILSLPAEQRPSTAAYVTKDDPFTQPQVDQARVMLEQGGVKTLSYQTYPETTTDYSLLADTIVISKAQIVVCGTQSVSDFIPLMQHFKLLHYNPSVLIATAGPDQGDAFLSAVGGAPSAEGILFPNGWYPQLKTPENATMVNTYLSKYKGAFDDISADTAEAYSVGQVAFQAITKIKSVDNAKLLAELYSGDTFQSVQGPVKFDATGQNMLAQAYLFQWQKGTFMPVYPTLAALATPEFPKPHWS